MAAFEGIEPSPIPEWPGVQAPFVPCTPNAETVVLAVGIEPTTYRLQGGCSTVEPCQHWLCTLGSNQAHSPLTAERTHHACSYTKNFGGLKVVGMDGFEPTKPKQQIYSLPRLTFCAASPRDGDQYDVVVLDRLFELVCAVGFEPTTSCAQDTRATTALRTEVIGGTWSRVFMMSRIVNLKIRTVNLKVVGGAVHF